MAHVYARPHHMLQTEEEVLDIVEDDPSTSTTEIAHQVNVSQHKVWKTLRENQLYPFHNNLTPGPDYTIFKCRSCLEYGKESPSDSITGINKTEENVWKPITHYENSESVLETKVTDEFDATKTTIVVQEDVTVQQNNLAELEHDNITWIIGNSKDNTTEDSYIARIDINDDDKITARPIPVPERSTEAFVREPEITVPIFQSGGTEILTETDTATFLVEKTTAATSETLFDRATDFIPQHSVTAEMINNDEKTIVNTVITQETVVDTKVITTVATNSAGGEPTNQKPDTEFRNNVFQMGANVNIHANFSVNFSLNAIFGR